MALRIAANVPFEQGRTRNIQSRRKGEKRKKHNEEPTVSGATPSAACKQQKDAHPVALTRGLNTITQYPSVLSTRSLNMRVSQLVGISQATKMRWQQATEE
jgi:hypothetical protein